MSEKLRIQEKLNLWEQQGFFQFIMDLQELKGPECEIEENVLVLKRLYEAKLKELDFPNPKQIKLDI